MKICKFCGEKISEDKNVCPSCGRKSDLTESSNLLKEEKNFQEDSIEETFFGLRKNRYNKWISLLLCVFLGWMGAHKFYERKYFLGIVYLFSWGFLGFGILLDFMVLIHKPNPYYLYQ